MARLMRKQPWPAPAHVRSNEKPSCGIRDRRACNLEIMLENLCGLSGKKYIAQNAKKKYLKF